LVLRDGRVLYAGDTRRVLDRNVLKDLYGVSLTVMKRKGRYWSVVK